MNYRNIINGFYRAIFRGDKYFRHSIFLRVVNFIYPNMVYTEYGKYFLQDKPFLDYYAKFEGLNTHSMDRKYTLLQFLKLIKNLKGDTVECGAFKGATSYLILGNTNGKAHHIFDSFEGLSKPISIDGDYWVESNLSSSEAVIRDNLKEFDNVNYYKGWIPQRFHEVEDLCFSFVHIDVDLYQPTKDSLEFFYPRLEKGGVIICDDSGFITCPGARKAMDEYAAGHGLEILDLPTGQGVIIKN